jgi:5-methyltetrahydrofolate--homocysteine methyltransferase
MLQKIVSEKLLTAKAIFGIFPANSNEQDDIELKNERKHSLSERFVNNIKNLKERIFGFE